MKNYRKSSHAVFDLKVHVAWITKYRKPVLTREIRLRLRDLIRQTCAAMDVRIESGHVAKDHIHLLLSIPPQMSVSQVMKRIKGRSSRMMQTEFAELKRHYWGKHLWARGYYAVSTGNVTEEMIKKYIEAHDKRSPMEDDDNFGIGDL